MALASVLTTHTHALAVPPEVAESWAAPAKCKPSDSWLCLAWGIQGRTLRLLSPKVRAN